MPLSGPLDRLTNMAPITIEGPAGNGRGPESIATLARALVELEARLEHERPESVVLEDDSDMALAAALVASKLLIPIEASATAISGGSANGRLIAQLATPYTAPR